MENCELKDYPPMMDVTQTARFLRTGKQAVYLLAKQEEFPAIMVGGKIRVIRDRLMNWFEANCNSKNLGRN